MARRLSYPEAQIGLTNKQARDLRTLLETERRRRNEKFAKEEIMECWICLDIIRTVCKKLDKAGAKEADHRCG